MQLIERERPTAGLQAAGEPFPADASPPPSTALARPAPTRRGWRLALVLLLAGGTIGAALSANAWHASVSSNSNQAFRTDASSIANALFAAIHRDEDYLATQRALFGEFPGLTNRRYDRWSATLDLSTRYPDSLGFAFVQAVPAAELHAFAAEVAADPAKGLATPTPSHYLPYPPGKRPAYCLMRLAYEESAIALADVAVFDFCAHVAGFSLPFPSALADARDDGSLVVAPPIFLYPGSFFMVEPVYRGDAVPTTIAARRRQLAGWALGTFDGANLVRSTMQGISGLSVSVAYQQADGTLFPIATAGKARGDMGLHQSLATGAGGRFLVTVTGAVGSNALDQALVVGLLVLGLTVLLALVFFLLARSRARALSLVDERTGELRHQALHDALTDLPNRALIIDRAEQMIARARQEPVAIGVLFIDLDNFKDINDSFGHHRGDELLRAVADRLSAVVRPSDSVGRLGGDEFVVLIEDHSLDAGPEVVADRVLEVLAQPFQLEGLDGVSLQVRASIGIAVGLRSGADELLRDADIALYQAKQAGKGRYVVFRQEMQLAVQDRLALELDLRSAIEERQLYVEYQPIFDLAHLTITGVEALARWSHPTRGTVGPDRFIPIAEESGLISVIGRFVLADSCRQAAAWRDAGHPVPLSVNISGRQLESDELPSDVEAALAASGLEASMLTLELTESVLMRDADATVRRLRVLKQIGVRIAVDDFGTGYSSLAYVRQFPIDLLKIDRSFISTLARSPEARAVVRTLVQLGKSLGLDTLAEGIEDEAQLAELQRNRCDHGQGFYYARPLSAAAMTELFVGSAALPGSRSPSAASRAALQRAGFSTEAASGESRFT